MQDMQPDNTNMPADPEGAMAKADLYKLANYSYKLFKMIDGQAQLDGWVQAKITKAADYIASVYHYMEYEMKFSEYGEQLENSDMYSESQKTELRNKLMEAKDKVKELKKKTADKMSKKDMPVKEEKSSTGGEIDRSKKGVTKHKQNTDRFSDEPHTEPKSKAKSQSASDKAGDKAADKAEEKEGKNWEKRFGKDSVTRVKDGKKVDEATTVNYDKDGKRTGVTHKDERKYSDEPHTEPKSQAKSRSAADKAGDKAADKAAEKDSKAYEKKHPGTVSRYKDGKKVDEAKKGDGNLANNAKPYDKVTQGDVVAGRLGKDEKGGKSVKEASTGDYSAKKAAAGKDIGKPGKQFAKIAAKAEKGGAKSGEAVAGAVLKKLRAKESVEEGKGDGNLANNAKPYDKVTRGDVIAGRLGKDEKGGKDAKKKGVKEAVAKAKAKMEGSIQGGVWVSTPDKGVAPPQDIDGGSAPAPKKAKSPFPSRNDPKKAADAAAIKPGTANPAMPSRNKETVKESADLDRMKEFLTRLNG